MIEKIWDGIIPVEISNRTQSGLVQSGPKCPVDCVKMWFSFIAPDRPNILKADSKNKKAIKD